MPSVSVGHEKHSKHSKYCAEDDVESHHRGVGRSNTKRLDPGRDAYVGTGAGGLAGQANHALRLVGANVAFATGLLLPAQGRDAGGNLERAELGQRADVCVSAPRLECPLLSGATGPLRLGDADSAGNGSSGPDAV